MFKLHDRNALIVPSRRVGLTATALAVVGSLLFSVPTTAFAAEDEPTVLASIENAAPEVLNEMAAIAFETGSPVAMQESFGDLSVAIPHEAEDGIVVRGIGADAPDAALAQSSIIVGLPFAKDSLPAAKVLDGAVAYDNGNGSTTVPLVKDDGSLQITTVLDNTEAPTKFEYPLSFTEGGSLQIADNGAAVVFDKDMNVTAYVAPAWAKDATGVSVPTHYESEGNTLIQVVEPAVDSVFPIVADPQFAWRTGLPSAQLNKAETRQAQNGTGVAKICGAIGGVLGWGAVALCGVSVAQITAKSIQNVSRGQCTQLVPAPGLILALSYSGGYCR